jgi:mycothiol synthase
MVELRPPQEGEAGAIAALMSVDAPEPITDERVRRNWSSPGVDMERDARVAVEGDHVTGFTAIERLDGERSWVELHGGPTAQLVDWSIRNASGRLFCGGWQQNERVRPALEERGFELVRHSYRMARDLRPDVPEPEWPQGIALRTFVPGDERNVYETHMETFEDSWEHVRQPFDEWAHWTFERPGFDPQLWLLATAGEKLAGISLCRVHDADPDTGWVSILGVRREWRRRGLGRALLLESFRRLASRGCRRAILGVDATSLTGANLLYASAGMRVLSRFDIYARDA